MDQSVAEPHLGMAEIAVLVGDDHAAFEPKRLLQPIERSPGVAVEHGRCQGRAAERIVHDQLLLVLSNISLYRELFRQAKTVLARPIAAQCSSGGFTCRNWRSS